MDVTEGMPIGVVKRSQGRTIGEGELQLLTDLTWTTAETHANRVHMQSRGYKDMLIPAPVLIAVVAGLWQAGPHNRMLTEEYGMCNFNALGVEARYRGPFYPGDTIWVESEVISARRSESKPGTGVIEMRDRGINQHGEVVIETMRRGLFQRTGIEIEK